jgi:IS30 family transposase
MSHHKDEIAYSLSSLYRLCEAGYFEFSKMHLTRAIRYKQRKERVKRDPRALPGREYSDFLELDEEAQFSAVQIDTVYGSQGGPTLLTLLLRRPHFMFIFLLESNTQAQVVHALDELEIAYGEVAFKRVFSTLLADRGSEFIDPDVIERGLSGNRRTSVYYCDPCAPWQKGSLERNHEYIRRILPKGTSFEFITKRHCSLLMSHINSAARPGLGGASPLELAPPQLPARVREYFGISLISADDVILNKTLLQDD